MMMYSKIVTFHISIIPERWYQDIYQEKNLTQHNSLIFAHDKHEKGFSDNSSSIEIILPICKDITVPKTVPIIKKTIDKRIKYGKLWGIVREVILLVLESDDCKIAKLY